MLAALTPHCRRRGITLVELLVVLAIMGVLVVLAAPSLNEFIMRKRVESIANELASDMRFARVSANQITKSIFIVFGNNNNLSCYTVFTEIAGGDCDCTGPAGETCFGDSPTSVPTELKTLRLAKATGVKLTSSINVFNFNSNTQMSSVNAFSITVQPVDSGGAGGALKLQINATGRPHLCAVSGHPAYPDCE